MKIDKSKFDAKDMMAAFDEWGAKGDPQTNANIVKMATWATVMLGTVAIGPLAIIALAVKGGYDLGNDAERVAFERFLAKKLETDPDLAFELKDRATQS